MQHIDCVSILMKEVIKMVKKNLGLNGYDWAQFGLTIAMGIMTLGNQQHLAEYQRDLQKINDTCKVKIPNSNGQ